LPEWSLYHLCGAGAVRRIPARGNGALTELRKQGYALLCVSYARSDLEVETQDEDEVYELQFGRYFGKGKVRAGLPLDEE